MCVNSRHHPIRLAFFICPSPLGCIMAHCFSLWFSSINVKNFLGVFQTYSNKNQPVKKSVYICLSSSSSPIFSVLICSDNHQILWVCCLVHNLEDFFLFYRNFNFYQFYLIFYLANFWGGIQTMFKQSFYGFYGVNG